MKSGWSQTLGVGLLLAAGLAASAAPLPEADRLKLADGLFAREMYGMAAAEYEGYLRDHGGSAQEDAARYRLGECYRALDRATDADKQFARAAAAFPTTHYGQRAAFRRADIYLEGGKPGIAATMYRELLAQSPAADIAAPALFFLAEALIQSGQPEEALAPLERIRADYADSTYLAYALLKIGELRTAAAAGTPPDDATLALLQTALERAPSDRVAAEARFQLASAYDARGDFARSAETYRTLLERHPQDTRVPLARLRGAWAAHNAGLHADALRMVDGVIDDTPQTERDDWLYLKANSERQLLQHEAALRTYDTLLARHPQARLAAAALYEKAMTLYRLARYTEAVEAARAVAQTPQNRKDLYWLIAEASAALNLDNDAIQYYRLIVTEFPDSDVAADATYRLAYRLQTRGDLGEAGRFYQQLADSGPTNRLAPQARFAAGLCLAQADRHAEAVQQWTRLVEEHRDDARVEEALYRKALSEVRLGRPEEARKSLRALRATAPTSPFTADAHFWLGTLARDAGQATDAEAEFQALLRADPRPELARETQLQLALILHQRGAFDDAAALLEPLVADAAGNRLTPSLLQWLAEHALTRTQPAPAAAAAEALIHVSTNDAGRQIGWVLLGRARADEQREADAVQAYERALALQVRTPYGADAALRLGDLKLAAGELEAADGRFEAAAAAATGEAQGGLRARAYAGLGRVAKARGDHAGAARYFLSVGLLYNDEELVPESLYEAALALQQTNQPRERQRTALELQQRYPASPWTVRAVAEGLTATAPAEGGVTP